MDSRHLEDVYELYLLGLLSAEESSSIAEHVGRSCPHCLARLREAARAVYAVLLARGQTGRQACAPSRMAPRGRKRRR